MDLQLQNKVVIVTGGSKGIGGAITDVFQKEGAIVVIAGRKEEDGKKKLAELQARGGEAAFFQIELRDADRRQALVDFVIEKYGRIDGLINNAGVNDSVRLAKGTVQEFLESYHKNVVHVFSLVQLC